MIYTVQGQRRRLRRGLADVRGRKFDGTDILLDDLQVVTDTLHAGGRQRDTQKGLAMDKQNDVDVFRAEAADEPMPGGLGIIIRIVDRSV